MAELKVDLRPQKLDLFIYSGDGYRFRLVIKDKDENPIPITGTFKAQIRKDRGTSDIPQAEFSIDESLYDEGKVGLILTGEDCQALAGTAKFKGFWDCEWTPEDTEPRTLVQGKLECDLDVSR